MRDLLIRALEGLTFADEYIEHEDIKVTIKDIEEFLVMPIEEPVAYLKVWDAQGTSEGGSRKTVSFYADNCEAQPYMLNMRTIPLVEMK